MPVMIEDDAMGAVQRILHVDDDESISAIARIALESVGGLDVCSCTSGQQALTRVAQFAPDVVLLDVMMPDMDGPATLAALAGVLDITRVPVVFMTAKVSPQDHAGYYALGAAAVIVKPFDPLTLADQVRAIAERFHACPTG